MFSVGFPGQGSQKIGMCKELFDKYPIVKNLFNQADDIHRKYTTSNFFN